MKYLYYPGCSLRCTGKAYEESLQAVFDALGVTLEELQDWNCCGATAYMAVDEMKAFALAARNLAIAEQQGGGASPRMVSLMVPCNACFLVLTKTQRYIVQYPEVDQTVTAALKAANLSYDGRVIIRHPLDILINDIRLETVVEHAKQSLNGLRVACYYGCQMIRPYATFDDQYNPMSMDRLLRALGAEPVDWPLKTRCCGGSLTGTIQEVGLRLNHILLREAKKRGADVIATACPLCQFNLECFQSRINRQFDEKVNLPVLYFTQLMGLALGLSKKSLGLQRLFVPLGPLPASQERGDHVGV